MLATWLKKSALTAVEKKIPDITGLAATSTLTAVENKIPNANSLINLVKKTDYDTKLLRLNKKITSNKTKHLLVED